MPRVEHKKNIQVKVANESDLKGTFVSVMVVAAFIIATWGGIYFLFMDRL